MLHILLLILKIIGIILAVAIGLILFLSVCVLLVPIRYKINADGKMGEEEPFHARIKISWLLHIVSAAFVYPQEPYVKVRLFGIPVIDMSKEKVPKEKKDKKEQKEDAGEAADPEETGDVGEAVDAGENAGEPKEEEWNTADRRAIGEQTEEAAEIHDPEEKSKLAVFSEAVVRFLKRLWQVLKNIEYTIGKICDRIKKIIADIEYYTDVLKSDVFQEAFHVAEKQLLRIFRTLRPRKCIIHLKAGTGDPASTGQLMAVYGMLYPFIGNHVFLQADFEEKVIEGNLLIKGRITILMLLISAFRLYTDKKIRQLLRLLKREEALNGRE